MKISIKYLFTLLAICFVKTLVADIVPAVHQEERSWQVSQQFSGVSLQNAEAFPSATSSLKRYFQYHGIDQKSEGYPIVFRKNPALPPEGYRLVSDTSGTSIEAADQRGAYYAVATLKQLFQPRHGQLAVEKMRIEDCPSLAFRGVLVFLSEPATPKSMEHIKKLFQTFSELKFNTILLGLMGNYQYETVSFPDAAFSKEQVQELIREADACQLEIIPYFQAMSHCPWILRSPEGKNLLEDPEVTSWSATWCPSNPATEDFFKRILRETVDLFKPRYIHLGFDEIGPFRKCARCREVAPEKLLADEIIRYHDFLASFGVKTIIWHDEFLERNSADRYTSHAQAWRAREVLPRDILINYWYYYPNPVDMVGQMKLFSDLGYRMIGAGFHRPRAIQMLSESMEESPSGDGMLATTWYLARQWGAGLMRWELPHYLVTTAESAWNTYAHGAERPGFDPVQVLMRNYFPVEIAPDLLYFTPVVFSENQKKWAELPIQRAGNFFPFAAAYGETAYDATRNCRIKIDQTAAALVILQEADAPSKATPDEYFPIGQWQVKYSDGTLQEIPLLYRWNISSTAAPYNAMLNQAAVTDPKSGRRYNTLFWTNPHPEKKIVSLELIRSDGYDGTFRIAALAVGNFNWSEGIYGKIISTVETFSYGSADELNAKWYYQAPEEVKISLCEERMRLDVPPLAGGRITLSKALPASATGGVLRIYSTFASPVRCGIYRGDKGWGDYYTTYQLLSPGWNVVEFDFAAMQHEKNTEIALQQLDRLQIALWIPKGEIGYFLFDRLSFFAGPVAQ